jgi:hypothetical protein
MIGLADARLMVGAIAMDVRHGVNPTGVGEMAVNLEHALSEMVHGGPQQGCQSTLHDHACRDRSAFLSRMRPGDR